MYLLVLVQQQILIPSWLEFWHFSRQHGEDVGFFYAVVGFEVGEELEACLEELPEGEVSWARVGFAGCVEEGPGLAEVVVLFIQGN